MKKFLAILCLGLLRCNIGIAEITIFDCEILSFNLKGMSGSDKKRFSGKKISLTIDTETKIITNNFPDSEVFIVHGIQEQTEIKKAKVKKTKSLSSMTDLSKSPLQFIKNRNAYTYETEILFNDQKIYKYDGKVNLEFRWLEVKIDDNRSALANEIFERFYFKFDCPQ